MLKRDIFGKKTFRIYLLSSFNGIMFGELRENIRKKINMKYVEYKKNEFSENTLDDYDLFHIYYDKENKFECVEIFCGKVFLDDILIFPGTVSNAKKYINGLEYDGYGYISLNDSVGITVSEEDGNEIEAILFGCKGYYFE